MSRPDDRAAPGASDERWRAFVAIDLAEPARSAVTDYLAGLRAAITGVGWTRPEHLHLTLAFLGEVPRTRIASVSDRLAAVLLPRLRFEARVVGLGAFPSVARPQVLWVGIASPELAGLADVVQGACEREGFPREQRPFRAHVTLGRVRQRGGRSGGTDFALLARDGDRDFGTTVVEHVVLYRSELGRGGARHTPLATFPLAGA